MNGRHHRAVVLNTEAYVLDAGCGTGPITLQLPINGLHVLAKSND